MCSVVRPVTVNLPYESCVLFSSSSCSSSSHSRSIMLTPARYRLGDSCGQSAACAFIDLFTSVFLALLKLFTSDTPLTHPLQDPGELRALVSANALLHEKAWSDPLLQGSGTDAEGSAPLFCYVQNRPLSIPEHCCCRASSHVS